MTTIEFGVLVSDQSIRLQGDAFRLTNDMEDAKDLIQETILKAIRYHEQYDKTKCIKAWLYVVMKNIFINSYRKRSKGINILNAQNHETISSLNYNSVNNRSESDFAISDIAQAVNNLPEIYGKTFLKYVIGYKYEEISKELQIPIGTVKTRIYHARELLRKSLSEYRMN